jgi:isochorismate synthase/2-succinyl-5-enolpyruvyl-6-hydroxy-3-cyclohexene-1-carboxylate synthase/2-succinyl-6-hydroxy-2,4-cyclohexadiene-1-carboxylate synthase/O-succinylbenzoate synthase
MHISHAHICSNAILHLRCCRRSALLTCSRNKLRGTLSCGVCQASRVQTDSPESAIYRNDCETSDRVVAQDELASSSTETLETGCTTNSGRGGGSTSSCVDVWVLPIQSSYKNAVKVLIEQVDRLADSPDTPQGCVRIEVPLCRGISALQWLKSRVTLDHKKDFSVYFSSKVSSAPDTEGSLAAETFFKDVRSVAGVGAAWMWKGAHGCSLDADVMADIREKTDDVYSRLRAFGGSRFDPGGVVGEEWEPFGSFCFLLPRVEFVEKGNGCVLACTLAWDSFHDPKKFSSANIGGFNSKDDAIFDALSYLSTLGEVLPLQASSIVSSMRTSQGSVEHMPDPEGWESLLDRVQKKLTTSKRHAEAGGIDDYSISATTALDEYLRNGQKGLDDLLMASRSNVTNRDEKSASSSKNDGLVKLVLARRTNMIFDEDIDCCELLASLQEKDPKAYQFMLRLPSGQCFMGCTPERLYARSGSSVVSEAVAGTRGRGPGGDIEKDFWLAFDLLQSQKDGLEFQLVRESIAEIFEKLCKDVNIEVEKSVLKQGSVQHLYGRIAGSLKEGVDDLSLVRELHPTPAVCGQPDEDALCLLRSYESFDRGLYAGPFGWFAKNAADIAVAIRSTLIDNRDSEKTLVSLFAGVGIVPGSITQSEWNELDLKISQFTNIFSNSTKERILGSQNLSILSAQMMVEELCRCGCNTFCIAPGSRSSPLTLAIAQHPRARLIPGIDERSLGFWALGHGKATGRPCVVVTSSGTAVANLLPAVVEASQSNVPMILMTADRPAELRDTGSNQTINQVGIFGHYVRWEADLIPPSEDVPLRKSISAISNAVRTSTSEMCSGPVHLNCQFREPLNPVSVKWDPPTVLQGLDQWISGKEPLTRLENKFAQMSSVAAIDHGILHEILQCRKGLLIVGELADPEDVTAAKQISRILGWPIVADILSGLRVGHAHGSKNEHMVNYMDHVLLSEKHWSLIKPDIVLHLGSRLTSKRVLNFLEWSALQNDDGGLCSKWILADRKKTRYDPSHLLHLRIECPLPNLLESLMDGPELTTDHCQEYSKLLMGANQAVERAIEMNINSHHTMSEVHIAKVIDECLPIGDGLFVGNSMPIRDLDMFSGPRSSYHHAEFPGMPIAANRGASGIDGVLSSAAGYADGLQRKSTLVIGDVSFLHDSNGLNLLRTGSMSPALTVVLINNSGGGIFNFLPIAGDVPEDQFRPLWTTPQHVDIAGICRAQGIPHMRISSLSELEKSLKSSWRLNRHCVLEVVTDIDFNVSHHSIIKTEVTESLDKFFTSHGHLGTVERVRVSRLSIPLKKPLTTSGGKLCTHRDVLHLLIDVICSDCGTRKVIGEIAPLPGLHAEDIEMAFLQAQELAKNIQGRHFMLSSDTLPLKKRVVGYDRILQKMNVVSLYPSVAFGLEAALWEAVQQDSCPKTSASLGNGILVSSLLDPHGKTENSIRQTARSIVKSGYSCIKIKAGRAPCPEDDAQYLSIVRDEIGQDITLRVDANQAWTFDNAMIYAEAVKDVGIQYIEEPLSDPTGLYEWSNYSSIPVALDECIDENFFSIQTNKGLPDCVKYAVLKPSVLGGMSKTAHICQEFLVNSVQPVISSSFESPTGLLHLAKICCELEIQGKQTHGISTESWFAEDFSQLTVVDNQRRRMPSNTMLTFSEVFNFDVAQTIHVPSFSYTVDTDDIHWVVTQFYPSVDGRCLIPDHRATCSPIILVHGMFGSSSEMYHLAQELAHNHEGRPILCVDLPGHGASSWKNLGHSVEQPSFCMIQAMASSLMGVLSEFKSCTLIGYSLGARISIMAHLMYPEGNISEVISISGGFGISDEQERAARVAKDGKIASSYESSNRQEFFEMWYDAPLWDSLRSLDSFSEYIAEKGKLVKDENNVLALMLKLCSPGKAPPMRSRILDEGQSNSSNRRIIFMAGRKDEKYAGLVSNLQHDIDSLSLPCPRLTTKLLPDVGHAMHLENPREVANVIKEYLFTS